MFQSINTLATGSGPDQFLYLIVVIALVLISAVAEKFKKKMAGSERKPGVPPQPPRGAMPPLPRPRIPQVPQSPSPQGRAATPPPPNAPFPRPPVRPVAQRQREERKSVIPGTQLPTQQTRRTVQDEIARQVMAGQRKVPRAPQPSAPRPTSPIVASQTVPAPAPAEAAGKWSVLTTLERKPEQHPTATIAARLRPLRHIATAGVRPTVAATSFRNLSVADLQRALVLKEILEPPLALRDG